MEINDNFERILLFKPQGDLTYIRKLSMSYGYYTALAVVSEHNTVTHIGANNNFQILPYKKLSRRYRTLLGSEKCSHLNDEDIMSVYRIVSPLQLNKEYRLLKKCHGMRYTLPEETYEIKRIILRTLSDKHGVSVNDAKGLGEYIDLYKRDIPLDFNTVLTNIDKDYTEITGVDNIVPLYTSTNAHGQTKLI